MINTLFELYEYSHLLSEDADMVQDLVHLEEDLEENAAGVSSDPLACVRRAVSGMLYADDAGIVSKSAEDLTKMMTVIVTVFEAAGLTVSEKKFGRTPQNTKTKSLGEDLRAHSTKY